MMEFALVLPIFLMLTFGIVEISLMIFNKAVITNASREGARAGIRYVPSNNYASVASKVISKVNSYCSGSLISLAGSNTCNAIVTPNSGAVTSFSPLVVKVNYQYQGLFLVPFLKFSSNGIVLESSTTMYME